MHWHIYFFYRRYVMTVPVSPPIDVDLGELRQAIQAEYAEVALHPTKGFHFHTGRPLARILGYADAWLVGIPEASIESFAGTGNPFSLGALQPGEHVVDVGSGAGIDSLIAAKMVGPDGHVVGVDMTPEMLGKARRNAVVAGLSNVEFREGFGEALPVPDGWADVVISNGVLNLFPDKSAGLHEMARVLKPGGRLQIGDIIVQKAVPESAKRKIDLWTG
jgi:arsenite methyltransferase